MRQKIKIILLFIAILIIAGAVFLIVYARQGIVKKSGYYYIDPNGKILNRDLEYQAYTEFNEDGIALVYGIDADNGFRLWYGFIDENGNVVSQFTQENDIYDEFRWKYTETVSFPMIVRDAGEIVILDKDFNRIGQLKEDDGVEVVSFDPYFSEGLAGVSVKKDGEVLCGYINTNGDWAIEPQFNCVCRFTEEGVAEVEDESTWWRIINKDGNYITEDRFADVSKFGGGYAMVQRGGDGAAAFINAEGNYITDFIYEFDNGNPGFSEGLSFVKLRGEKKYGYINEHGDMVIDPTFDHAYEFSNGLAQIFGGGFMDKTGKIVIENIGEAEKFSDEGYSVVKAWEKFDGKKYSYRYGIIDTKGEWVYEPQFVAEPDKNDLVPMNSHFFRAPKYHNGYLVVYLEKGQKIKKAK